MSAESPGTDRLTVIIPTYWTWPSTESQRPTTAAYDHPTPLDGDSTLPRLLDDLCEQRGTVFRVLILSGLADPQLGQRASDHMHALLEPYRDRLELYICDAPTWLQLQSILESAKLPTRGFHLGSYNGVRNLQLLVPHIMGAQVIVALDDDESVQPDYLKRSLTFIGQEIDGEQVLGLAGPYLQPDGSALLNESALTGNLFRDKGHYINEAMRLLTDNVTGLVPSPMALGGNMVFHHDVFTRVPFDPGITRGEDIDYLINARLQDIRWWFDAELTILHLPPRHYETPLYQRLREDVFRFIYEREKLQLHGHAEPAWLDPYPGALLRGNLIEQALSALQAEATPELVTRFGEPAAIVEQARAYASNTARQYPAFVQAWEQVMTRIEQDAALRRELLADLIR